MPLVSITGCKSLNLPADFGGPALGRSGTLDYLVHLCRNLSGARLLMLGTYRDVEVDRTHLLSSAMAELRRGPAFARMQLRGSTPARWNTC